MTTTEKNCHSCEYFGDPNRHCGLPGACRYESDRQKAEGMLESLLEETPGGEYFYTGSRHICNPPVLDTDLDIVFDCSGKGKFEEAQKFLESKGFFWVDIAEDEYDDIREHFMSLRFGHLNFILCKNKKFYRKFALATEIAKRMNVTDKQHRIMLFQAILYEKLDGEEFYA